LFTGLIEELGIIVDLKGEGTSLCLKIEAERVFSGSSVDERSSAKNLQNGLKIGDSVAVNGVCLTATHVQPPYFEVTAVKETLAKTTLGSLSTGSRINLERAASLETRLGGHLVQGHIDGTAQVSKIEEVDGSWELYLELPLGTGRYVVPQGSIAIDGISLTVAQILSPSPLEGEGQGEVIKIAIIPHTYYHTTIQYLKTGDRVNVEFDVIAKMVERLVKPYSS
jgi:riboflavin synthase